MKHRLFARPRTVVAFAGSVVAAAAILGILARDASAQELTATTSDAAVLRPGSLRLRAVSAWTRYDLLFGIPGASGRRPLGSLLTTDSLGPAQLLQLGQTQSAVQQLTGNSAVHVSAGQLATTAGVRIVVMPFVAEYGLTDRLTVGVMIPVVQSRSTVMGQLNRLPTNSANVGLNPSRFFGNASAQASNAAATSGLNAAAAQLTSQLTACSANPLGSGCATLLARTAEAPTVVLGSTAFAAAASALYGTGPNQLGQTFVPITGSDAEKAVDAQLVAYQLLYQGFGLNAGATSLTAAGGPAGTRQLQQLLRDSLFGIARDTLGIHDRFEVGDVEVGATYQLKNSFNDSAMALGAPRQYRASIQGIVRLGTGRPPKPNTFFDVGSGDGQTDVEVRGALDVKLSQRWMWTGVGSYVAQLGHVPPPAVGGSPYPLDLPVTSSAKAGNIINLEIAPRLNVTRYIFLSAAYAFRHQGVSDTASSSSFSASSQHQIGFGLSYASVGLRQPGAVGIPIEVSYTSLHTIYASGGPTPKSSRRSRCELRYYFGWRH